MTNARPAGARAPHRQPGRGATIALLGISLLSPAVHGQTWTADVYAGGTRYESLVDRVSATNLIANLRYQTLSNTMAYLSVAAPLDNAASVWGALGGSARPELHSGSVFSFGVESSAHGYTFREQAADGLSGGVSFHALPYVTYSRGASSIELRSGGNQHLFSFADTSGGRGLFEAGARAATGTATYRAQLDARWLRADEAAYPYAGVQLAFAPSFGRIWGWGGRWFADSLDDAVWGVGASFSIARAGELWLSVREDAADPLYQSSARRSWNIGFSRQIGGPRAPSVALAPKLTRGAVQIRLPASAVPGDNGAVPAVAGEFNEWTAAPMRREGGTWLLDLPLAAGVYRFAFVTATGEWFVPEGYPGRMSDGMGGYVALIVVP